MNTPKKTTEKNDIQEYVAIKEHVEGAFLRMGELLKNIRDEKLFLGQYESFDDFLLDTKTSKSTASKLIQIHERFIIKYKIAPEKLIAVRSWATLYEIGKILPNDAEVEEVNDWIAKGTLMSQKDVTRELTQRGKPVCSHDNTYKITVCKDCGEKMLAE